MIFYILKNANIHIKTNFKHILIISLQIESGDAVHTEYKKKKLIRPSLSYRQLSTILTHKTNLAQFTDTYRRLKLGSCFVHAYTKDYSFLLLTAALLHKQKILNTAYCLNCTNYCKTSRGVCQCVDMSSH